MRNQRLFQQKVHTIQHGEYQEAMRVPEYNEGRSVSQISRKTYIHGTRQYLRPDSMWADERYIDVTQAEINEAKARNAQRQAAAHHGHGHGHGHDHGHGHGHDDHSHDYAYYPPSDAPLYP